MTHFRKKPVVIEARQYDGWNMNEIASFVGNGLMFARRPEQPIHILTLEGPMEGAPGDWIIRGVKGEFYPCKPDIFEATYEEIDASEVER